MRAPQTTGDWVFFLALSSLVFAMGVWFFLDPLEPMPEDRSAYAERSGRLEAVLARESGRRRELVKFRIVGDPWVYESRVPRILELSSTWREGQTPLAFHTRQRPAEPGTFGHPRPVYGLVADGVVTRSLAADIQHHNAIVSPWLGLLPLGIGGCGYLVAGLALWRRRAA